MTEEKLNGFPSSEIEKKMKEAVRAARIEFGPAATNLPPQLKQQFMEMGILKKTEEASGAHE